MLYYLFRYLHEHFDLPGTGVFQYISFRAALSIIVSLLIAQTFGAKLIRVLQRKQVGESIRDLGLQGQMEKKGTPTMGGLIILLAILVPVLLPVATSVGIDPVHLGVVIVLALTIGLLTPPVGLVLYVLAAVSGVRFDRCVRATAPFLIPLVAVLLLVAFVPQLSLALPMAVGK